MEFARTWIRIAERLLWLIALFAVLSAGAFSVRADGPYQVVRYFVLHVFQDSRNPVFEIAVNDRGFPNVPGTLHRFDLLKGHRELFVRLTRLPGPKPIYRLEQEPLAKDGRLYLEMLRQYQFTFSTFESRGTLRAEEIAGLLKKEENLDPRRVSITIFQDSDGNVVFFSRAFDGSPEAAPPFLGPWRTSRLRSDGMAETVYGNWMYTAETSPPADLPLQTIHPYYKFNPKERQRLEFGRIARDRRVRDHLPSMLSQQREFLASTQYRYDSGGNYTISPDAGVYADATGETILVQIAQLTFKNPDEEFTETRPIVAGLMSRKEVELYRPDLVPKLAADYQHPDNLPAEPRPEMQDKKLQRFMVRQSMRDFFDLRHLQFGGALPLRCEPLMEVRQWRELMSVGDLH